ncbi:MAG TPA: hypothetical protein ENG87_01185 [Candidatus Pacearchaeota archaeon]|nr:hypothetical protein [Candidatus Pacearchaeota archaeon]
MNFNIGTNFETHFLNNIIEMNNKYKNNKITEMYGSLKNCVSNIPTARPDFRIPDITVLQFKEYVKKCHENFISFNYTANSPLTSDWFYKSQIYYKKFSDFLKDMEIDVLTLSHPLPIFAEYLSNQNFGIEISTILDVNNIDAIKYYCEHLDVKKICLSISKNRDFQFLEALAKTKYVNRIELLVNEFCNIKGIPCQNFYRKSCYELHSLGGNPDNFFGGFPMKWCSHLRREPVSWLKSNIIMPHDLHYYTEMGYQNFKISGRTLTTKFITNLAEVYLSEGKDCFNNNLLSLWGHVNKISANNVNTSNLEKIPDIFLSMERLKEIDFLKFFKEKRESCDNVLCEKCTYCHKIYRTLNR